MTAGPSFAGRALKVLELYAGKLARTVLRGRKLPCPLNKFINNYEETTDFVHLDFDVLCMCKETK